MATSLSQEEKAQSKPSLAATIMLTKGAFVTPRSVIKNMTTKKRPHAEEVVGEMKSLEQKEVGYIKYLTRAQTVFYKPLPSDENKDKVVEVIGSDLWDTYIQCFKEADIMYITVSQHNRMLLSAENKEDLESFGCVSRSSN